MEVKQPLVIFYSSVPRLFRTTFIGSLYEICQEYPTILLSEKLDAQTEKALSNKNLFPKLFKIIPVYQFTGPRRNLLSKNIYLYKKAKEIINEYKPKVVIVENDLYPFEMYLLRFAKRVGALKIAMQGSLKGPTKSIRIYYTLSRAYENFSKLLPLFLRIFFVKLQRNLGHYLVYWLFPLLVKELPFFGRTSYIKWNLTTGLRNIDYYAVFSKREYDLFLKEGVPKEKLLVLSHPLTRKTKNFFQKVYFYDILKKRKEKIITIIWPAETIGFKRDDYSPIFGEEFWQKRLKIIETIKGILSEWKIIIKPHPQTQNFQQIKKIISSVFSGIEVVNPFEPVDKFIEISDIIISFPPPSTVLYITTIRDLSKIVIYLDLFKEFLGDFYKDFPGIKYIDKEEEFVRILKLIRNGNYKKEKTIINEEEKFEDASDLLKFCLTKK